MTYVLADCSRVKMQGGFLFSRNLIVQIHKIQFGMARTYYYVQFKLDSSNWNANSLFGWYFGKESKKIAL